jgi:hypothetical protein
MFPVLYALKLTFAHYCNPLIVEKIEQTMDDNPELLKKTIQQDDILAHVLGKRRMSMFGA